MVIRIKTIKRTIRALTILTSMLIMVLSIGLIVYVTNESQSLSAFAGCAKKMKMQRQDGGADNTRRSTPIPPTAVPTTIPTIYHSPTPIPPTATQTPTPTPTPIPCYDSDGGDNPDDKGFVTKGAGFPRVWDSCIYDENGEVYIIQERYCSDSGEQGVAEHVCPKFCLGGVCVPFPTSTPEPTITPTPTRNPTSSLSPTINPSISLTPTPTRANTQPIARLNIQGAPANADDLDVSIIIKKGSSTVSSDIYTCTSDSAKVVLCQLPTLSPGTYDFTIKAWAHLKRITSNIQITNSTNEIDLTPQFMYAGDISGDSGSPDNVINTLDIGYIMEEWGKSNSHADINKDGKVDGLDVSFILQNYLLKGM
jgi:hypothetical protein